MTAVERLVGESAILPPEQERERAGGTQPHDFRRRIARPLQIALCRAPPRRQPNDVYAVGERFLERRERTDARDHVLRLMRDPFDAVRIVFARIHEPQVAQAEVFHPAHDVGDVDQILRLVQDDDQTHPTSSRIPNLAGSCLSPRSHTQPPPPLQTSCPTRRSRPGNISLTMRSNRTRLPACAYTPSG